MYVSTLWYDNKALLFCKNVMILDALIGASFKLVESFFSCYKEILHVVLKKLKCGAFLWFIFPTVYHNLIESIRAAKWLRQMVTLLQF